MCEGAKSLRQKVWTCTKILSSNIYYFVAILRFLEIFGQRSVFFGSKTVFLGQEVHCCVIYIVFYTELYLQIYNYVQNRRFCRKNSQCLLDKKFYRHFCPANFCQLLPPCLGVYTSNPVSIKMQIFHTGSSKIRKSNFHHDSPLSLFDQNLE